MTLSADQVSRFAQTARQISELAESYALPLRGEFADQLPR